MGFNINVFAILQFIFVPHREKERDRRWRWRESEYILIVQMQGVGGFNVLTNATLL